jgi:hypothetical protein
MGPFSDQGNLFDGRWDENLCTCTYCVQHLRMSQPLPRWMPNLYCMLHRSSPPVGELAATPQRRGEGSMLHADASTVRHLICSFLFPEAAQTRATRQGQERCRRPLFNKAGTTTAPLGSRKVRLAKRRPPASSQMAQSFSKMGRVNGWRRHTNPCSVSPLTHMGCNGVVGRTVGESRCLEVARGVLPSHAFLLGPPFTPPPPPSPSATPIPNRSALPQYNPPSSSTHHASASSPASYN